MADTSDDFALLAAWRDGDASAGAALVRRHTPSLHRFFASKAPDAVEDLVQATFMACVESRDRFRHGSAFRTFVLAIGRKILLKHYRKRMRHAKAMAIEGVSAETIAPSPSLGAALREEVRVLLGALRRIPIDHQTAIELFYWEGLSVDEVAEVLEVAPGTIKSRLSRAREALRQEILAGVGPPPLLCSTAEELERWAHELRHTAIGPTRDP
jgi:RNA polymerase sigma factor (sigma-70 family)